MPFCDEYAFPASSFVSMTPIVLIRSSLIEWWEGILFVEGVVALSACSHRPPLSWRKISPRSLLNTYARLSLLPVERRVQSIRRRSGLNIMFNCRMTAKRRRRSSDVLFCSSSYRSRSVSPASISLGESFSGDTRRPEYSGFLREAVPPNTPPL